MYQNKGTTSKEWVERRLGLNTMGSRMSSLFFMPNYIPISNPITDTLNKNLSQK